MVCALKAINTHGALTAYITHCQQAVRQVLHHGRSAHADLPPHRLQLALKHGC